MNRGMEVTVIGFRGVKLRRRVWEDVGAGVLVCAEDDYHRALSTGDEPPCAGFPKQDVLKDGEVGWIPRPAETPPPRACA